MQFHLLQRAYSKDKAPFFNYVIVLVHIKFEGGESLVKASQNKSAIEILEKQLEYMNRKDEEQSRKIDALTEQVRQLTKLLFGRKSEKSKYIDENQLSLFDDDPFFNDTEQTGEQSQQEEIAYTVVRKAKNKKRNDVLSSDVEIEEIHHHPENKSCDCCKNEMTKLGKKVVREEAKFIPAKMKKLIHIEHSYECKKCKQVGEKAQVKRGRAPSNPIMRSIAGPTVLAKIIYDKFALYLPLYRQVKEWARHGLMTNDKNLSNWVILSTEEFLSVIYEKLNEKLKLKNILYVDETTGKVIKRSDGKSGASTAYTWLYKSSPTEGPIIVLFQSALTRQKTVFTDFVEDFKGTVICDGYSVYKDVEGITFANCWAHVRRKWINAKNEIGEKGKEFCTDLYKLEREFRGMKPSKRRRLRRKKSKKILDEFFNWIEKIQFTAKGASATAASYTLKRKQQLSEFLNDGRIEIDNNPAENAIRPNVLGRKNWIHSFSEAGAKANAICLSIAETCKANGIDFYEYLVKLFTELPNVNFKQNPEIIDDYMPWSKNMRLSCGK